MRKADHANIKQLIKCVEINFSNYYFYIDDVISTRKKQPIIYTKLLIINRLFKESTTDVVFAIKVISMLILSLFLWPPILFKQRKTCGTKYEGRSDFVTKTNNELHEIYVLILQVRQLDIIVPLLSHYCPIIPLSYLDDIKGNSYFTLLYCQIRFDRHLTQCSMTFGY